jgi:hypothetical protein
MKINFTKLCGAIAFIYLSGCAHVDIKPTTASSTENGKRFYSPEPYLFQVKSSDKGCISSIIFLPDLEHPWLINFVSGWGSAKGSATVTDGWNLTAFNQEFDSKGPETITALVGAAKLGMGAAAPEPGESSAIQECKPALRKLKWENGEWKL